ncbi:MAG: ribonuclease E activity regulator RraA [Woeseiaceae bacterium]|nr:ribonuclease E activity regulator RraA [Woeseiaceae bacterium]
MKPTADLYDDHKSLAKTCSTQFQDFGGKTSFFGPIRTVRCYRDNQLFRALLDEPGHGAVVVVDGGGSTESALMGDIIAAKGAKNGWAGVVILGAIRDSAAVGEIDFGVKALGVNPAKSAKLGEGAVDETVSFGGVDFEPGHWIYCDEDGVLVSQDELDVS